MCNIVHNSIQPSTMYRTQSTQIPALNVAFGNLYVVHFDRVSLKINCESNPTVDRPVQMHTYTYPTYDASLHIKLWSWKTNGIHKMRAGERDRGWVSGQSNGLHFKWIKLKFSKHCTMFMGLIECANCVFSIGDCPKTKAIVGHLCSS